MTAQVPSRWARMRALTESALSGALGQRLDERAIRNILRRRDRMQKTIDDLVKNRGQALVFVR